ncbi:MAG TPA: ATP-binding protein [Sulfurovum sp.]|nr:ATP-binding protein [Sulfurovum sp.]
MLSLREYLELKYDLVLESYTLEALYTNHEKIAHKILDVMDDKKILKEFNTYRKQGAYPFYFDDGKPYFQKIVDSMNTVMHTDIALLYAVPADKIAILKKLMMTICVSKPLELSMEKLTRVVGVSKVTLYKYIEYLHRAELLHHVTHEGKRFKNMQKPDKLYLANTNLCDALCMDSDIGTRREIFFVNQVSYGASVYYVDKGDFLVAEKYTVEVGGKGKTFMQIQDIEHSFVAADELEMRHKHKIPLCLFGFLY